MFCLTDLETNCNVPVSYETLPNECPICHTAISVSALNSYLINKSVYQTRLCPKCKKIFLSLFWHDGCFAHFSASFPFTPQTPTFPEEIIKRFTSFVTIYNQAYQAEQEKLLEICGMGYRKALEFLIKDYLISVYPEKESEIKNSLLGTCINNYVDNPKIKICASRAAWLGNDYSHYVKKHTDKDLQDLKTLILATVSWINTEIITDNALSIENK